MTYTSDIKRALQVSWRARLTDVSSDTGHAMMIEAANYASSRHERETAAWYATAINYMTGVRDDES